MNKRICGYLMLSVLLLLGFSSVALCSTGYGFWNRYLLPGVASAPGQGGTYWRTDVNIVNPHSWKSLTVKVWFHRYGVDNTNADPIELTIPAHQQITIEDILANRFGTGGAGALLIISVDGTYFTANARTYTGSGSTFGQAIQGQGWTNRANGSAVTEGVRNSGNYRCNVGVVNDSSRSFTVAAEVFDKYGNQRGYRQFSLKPWGGEQVSVASFASDFETGYVRWTCLSNDSGARWVAYASVVDNATGDAVFFEERPDDVSTTAVPSFDLTGGWQGTITSVAGTVNVEVDLTQEDGRVSAYVYDATDRCLIMFVEGSESRGVLRFNGYSYQLDCLGSTVAGTASLASAFSISGGFSGTGCFYGGGALYLYYVSGAEKRERVAARAENGRPEHPRGRAIPGQPAATAKPPDRL